MKIKKRKKTRTPRAVEEVYEFGKKRAETNAYSKNTRK